MKRFILLAIASSIISATTINIPEDFTTIQEGINAAETGDTVLVGLGTYYENLILDKEIVLSSHAMNDDLSENFKPVKYYVKPSKEQKKEKKTSKKKKKKKKIDEVF